ncbi:MAG: hypothetical protein OHK93_006499 [Ramalina farinacea]|uniref:Essential protein Yae1 N-terminal domain-containing protein n=1 Tax=Ramalina farinacea TaxID=258253 RepID=A0AA43TUL5_9LECA|nr:hypothetical protein [Ramalina farinacea]
MSQTRDKEHDPFDAVLDLEEGFFQEGYELGLADGERAGRIEGRAFGLEKGFEKYIAMGRLHGRAQVWAGSLNDMDETNKVQEIAHEVKDSSSQHHVREPSGASSQVSVTPSSARLHSHVRTLFALTEPSSLSVENTEDSVSDFDHRLKRAEGKVKVIEKLKDAVNPYVKPHSERDSSHLGQKVKREGSIEDIRALNLPR